MKSIRRPRLRLAAARSLLWSVLASLLVVPVASAQPSDGETVAPSNAEPAAYVLPAGSLSRQRIVAIGQDMVIDGEARSHAVVISGDARVSGSIEGDLIVLGGNASLGSGARVAGDVYILGGLVEMEPGVQIGGRSAVYPRASDVWMALVEGPSLGAPWRVVVGAKLALLAFWSFLMLLFLSIGRRDLVSTSESILEEPFHNFFVGLTGVAAMTMTAMFFSAFAGALIGVPLLALVAIIALVLRFWGMVAAFHALGVWLHQRLGQRFGHRFGQRVPVPLTAATSGFVVLGLIKLVPYLGLWVWSMATFIGIGAALSTKFGRREAWIEA